MLQQLNEIIVKSIFKKLKIDGITISSKACYWEGDGRWQTLPEKRCYGFNFTNKSIKPIFSILNSNNIKYYLSEEIINYVIAESLINSKKINILKLKPIDFIIFMLHHKEPSFYEFYQNEEYWWEFLFLENKEIKKDALYMMELFPHIMPPSGSKLISECSFDENYEPILPILPEKKYVLDSIDKKELGCCKSMYGNNKWKIICDSNLIT